MNKLTGEIMIFKGDYGYSTSVSNKKPDGTYDKMYISVQMPKDVELENQTTINITNGFLSFYKTKEGLPKAKIVVLDYEVKNKKQETENTDNYSTDYLPF